MLCNACGKIDATVHLTEILNGQMFELHLCPACAQEKEGAKGGQVSLNEMLSGLMDLVADNEQGENPEHLCCPKCKLTYSEFGRTGRLGCPDCYNVFRKVLVPLLQRVQRGERHKGKSPLAKAKSDLDPIEDQLLSLQKLLKDCISKEEFERAAELRDKIEDIKKKASKAKSVRNKK